ncbi:DUF3035 domain-containing protein [Pacificimonas flava]|uniref:DUF3035 domain-containing protein n=1 Tax=Pacificimonas flava TaxID=1234595 RepID=M2U4K7_9SPHN|nr:DUF3035 domain-containing protein [Pacificimonas flava]EMD82967.1 hypothetical protein C725_1565 [Pacificimonas flava]MBB5280127.1 hypothetical protein [Pacificimonas flava]
MKSIAFAVMGGALILTACGGGGGLSNRQAPDEFAITRNAPLVVPPDFALEPPRPGAPRAIESEAQAQAMEALFGAGVRPPAASRSEEMLLRDAGAADAEPAARSVAGSAGTDTVNKGAQVKDIVAAPAGTQDPNVGQASLGTATTPVPTGATVPEGAPQTDGEDD